MANETDYSRLSGSGTWNAISGGLGLVGDIAGAFSKNASARAQNAYNKAKHKNDLAIWHAKNAETARTNQYRLQSWELQNNNLIAGYNRRVDIWNLGKETYDTNIANIQNKLDQDYFYENVNLRRLYGDLELNNFEELKEFIAKQGTVNNEQTGVSAARNELMAENEFLYKDAGNKRQMRQLVENYEAANMTRQITASNQQANVRARLGIPPTQPTLLPPPPMSGGPWTSPMQAPQAQGFGWGDALKIGINTASTVAGFYGSPSNFMQKVI